MDQPRLFDLPTRGKLERAFWEFHGANPEVYRMLVRFAQEWRQARGKSARLGVKALFERVRWEVALARTDALGFKLNNNYTAYYARLIMVQERDLADIFKLRRQRVPATVGPANEILPEAAQVS